MSYNSYRSRSRARHNRDESAGRVKKGVKELTTKDGVIYYFAWYKKPKRPLMSFSFYPRVKGDKLVGTSDKGKEWEKWVCNYKRSDTKRIESAFFYPESGYLICQELKVRVNTVSKKISFLIG